MVMALWIRSIERLEWIGFESKRYSVQFEQCNGILGYTLALGNISEFFVGGAHFGYYDSGNHFIDIREMSWWGMVQFRHTNGWGVPVWQVDFPHWFLNVFFLVLLTPAAIYVRNEKCARIKSGTGEIT